MAMASGHKIPKTTTDSIWLSLLVLSGLILIVIFLKRKFARRTKEIG